MDRLHLTLMGLLTCLMLDNLTTDKYISWSYFHTSFRIPHHKFPMGMIQIQPKMIIFPYLRRKGWSFPICNLNCDVLTYLIISVGIASATHSYYPSASLCK